MVGEAQKLHGARFELNSAFSLEKVDQWNPIRTSAIQSRKVLYNAVCFKFCRFCHSINFLSLTFCTVAIGLTETAYLRTFLFEFLSTKIQSGCLDMSKQCKDTKISFNFCQHNVRVIMVTPCYISKMLLRDSVYVAVPSILPMFFLVFKYILMSIVLPPFSYIVSTNFLFPCLRI
jgi:hypothetical protein